MVSRSVPRWMRVFTRWASDVEWQKTKPGNREKGKGRADVAQTGRGKKVFAREVVLDESKPPSVFSPKASTYRPFYTGYAWKTVPRTTFQPFFSARTALALRPFPLLLIALFDLSPLFERLSKWLLSAMPSRNIIRRNFISDDIWTSWIRISWVYYYYY